MPTDYRFQPKGLKSNMGWYDRGYIPHLDAGQADQFLTFRLFYSVPKKVIESWKLELNLRDDQDKTIFRKRIEKYADQGYGECFLRDKRVASMVQDALLFHDEEKYQLNAWVVMPNHLHFLVRPFENIELRKIAHSIKSYTANEANKILGRKGQFWQHEPFDRYIRNYEHFANVIEYIEMNPVKARLCKSPEEWRFSSAWFRNT